MFISKKNPPFFLGVNILYNVFNEIYILFNIHEYKCGSNDIKPYKGI